MPAAADLLCSGLRWAYDQGWASGTGGGVCIREGGDTYYAPSAMHKELVLPRDLYVHRRGKLVPPAFVTPEGPTACRPIFDLILQGRADGAVLHTHSQWAVLAAKGRPLRGLPFAASGLEMLKGLTGYCNTDTYTAPVISNTLREADLVESFEKVFAWHDYCVMIERHGAYIWGKDWWECKRHAEVLHWLWEYEWRELHDV